MRGLALLIRYLKGDVKDAYPIFDYINSELSHKFVGWNITPTLNHEKLPV